MKIFRKVHCKAYLKKYRDTIDKQYRIRVEKEFDGFLVGTTSIVISRKMGTDNYKYNVNMNDNLNDAHHLIKYNNKEKVGVVYFKNNVKRYVYLDDMEVIEE